VQNKIRTDRTSYAHGDPLAVTFSAAGAATGDWVAIHPAEADPGALHTTSVPWLWTCGSRLCFMGASAGTLAFDSSELDPGGSYRVHLIPEDGYRWKTQSYVASASSEVFFRREFRAAYGRGPVEHSIGCAHGGARGSPVKRSI